MVTFLPEEAAGWCRGKWKGKPEKIVGVSTDTRTIKTGNIFVALKGINFDGHDYVEAAFSKGASAAIIAENREKGAWQNILIVDDPSKALRDMASNYRLKVDPCVLAITGSVGKSTVKEMTAGIFAKKFNTAFTRGNWNNDIGLPLSLLEMEANSDFGVYEIGMNHPGEIRALCEILKPDWGIITNVGPVHIEYFGSIEEIAMEKASLLESLPSDGGAILDKDNSCFKIMANRTKARVVTISQSQDSDYVYQTGTNGIVNVFEKKTEKKTNLKLNVPGIHNQTNAVMAAAAAREHGIEWELIKDALLGYKPLPMRWEESMVKGIRIVNDAYNANPMSMRASIDAFCTNEEDVKWVIVAGMLELGWKEEDEHKALGQYIAGKRFHKLVCIGRLGRLIAHGAVANGLSEERLMLFDDNDSAVKVLKGLLKSGDKVLLKASRGMKLEQILYGLSEKQRTD